MNERNFSVSPVQVFCLLFFYLLSGMLLFCGGSFFAALLAALFAALLCLLAGAFARGFGSSLALYGDFGAPLRFAAAFFSALPLWQTLREFSAETSHFHVAENKLSFAPFIAIACIFALSGGFHRAARFAEVCIFFAFAAALLALFGGGEGVDFSFGEEARQGFASALGAPAAFFSLYLRCVTPEKGEMSAGVKNSAFHPSPLSAGLCAAPAAFALYLYFCFAGNNVLFSLCVWFFSLSRLLLISLAMAELLAYPENGEGIKCAFASCAFCAFWAVFDSLFPQITVWIQTYAVFLLPIALCLGASVLSRPRRRKTA